MLCLSSPDEVRAGNVPIPNAMPFSKPYFYTVEQYKAHLQNIIDKLESTEMYNVILTDKAAENSLIMFVQGSGRAMLIRAENPFTVVNVVEPRLTSAFCNYLNLTADAERHKCSRQGTIKRLKRVYCSSVIKQKHHAMLFHRMVLLFSRLFSTGYAAALPVAF